jgi:hypothetical protein
MSEAGEVERERISAVWAFVAALASAEWLKRQGRMRSLGLRATKRTEP